MRLSTELLKRPVLCLNRLRLARQKPHNEQCMSLKRHELFFVGLSAERCPRQPAQKTTATLLSSILSREGGIGTRVDFCAEKSQISLRARPADHREGAVENHKIAQGFGEQSDYTPTPEANK